METFILVLAGFGLLFLLLVLLLLSALSAGGGGRSGRSESGYSSPDSEPRRSVRRGIPLWQLLLAIVLLRFTSDSEDDGHG